MSLPVFAAVFLAAASLAYFEWGGLAGLERGGLWAYLLLYWVCAGCLWFVPGAGVWVLLAALLFWLWACIQVLRFPRSGGPLKRGWLVAGMGLLVFLAAWQSLVSLKALPQGAWLLVWVFVLVWGADIGGYFAGKAWGKRALAARVSPGKTWEGACGGLALAMLVALSMVWLIPAYHQVEFSAAQWLGIALLLVGLSMMGDLFESVLKRVRGVKDSGGIMPGHGGLLDRVDALIAVLPVFALIMSDYQN